MDSIGQRIRQMRKMRRLTQAQLGARCNMADSAIRRYESDRGNPTLETLQRIADALEISVDFLVDSPRRDGQAYNFWDYSIEFKLNRIGYSIGSYEEDAMLWINYPDGSLEVGEDDLKALDEDTDSYLRFKLLELKERRPKDFRPEPSKKTAQEYTSGGADDAVHKEENE